MLSNSYPYKPLQFFILAIIGTWTCWIPAAFLSFETVPKLQNLELQLLLLGLFPPAITALYFIYSSRDPKFIQAFKDKFSMRAINKNYLPIILLLLPVSLLLAIILSMLLKHSPYSYFHSYLYPYLNLSETCVTFIMPSQIRFLSFLLILLIPFLEEVAWRGYGVDSLRSKFNLFHTSLIFALLWAIWHLPLLFINHWEIHPLYIANFFLSFIPFSIIINWIYYSNNRSIIAAVIIHFYIDLTEVILKGAYLTQALMTIFLTIASFIVIFKNKDLFFKY